MTEELIKSMDYLLFGVIKIFASPFISSTSLIVHFLLVSPEKEIKIIYMRGTKMQVCSIFVCVCLPNSLNKILILVST